MNQGNKKRRSPKSNDACGYVEKLSDWITLVNPYFCMFPEEKLAGRWGVQSEHPTVISIMKRRCRQSDKWRQIGWGHNAISPDIFLTKYASRRDAERSFETLLKTVEAELRKTA